MIAGIWGKKIGMTQVFVNDKVRPISVIDVNNWVITNIRTVERDKYHAVQVGLVKKKYRDQKLLASWLKNTKKYFTVVREIKLSESVETLTVGKPLDFTALLSEGDKVDVFGITKGCGFAGVVRRHNFAGARASHGSTMGDKPGSIGGSRTQGKVHKGKKMPGHMGTRKRVMQNLQVVQVNKDPHMVLVHGSIPGKAGSLVFIRKV